MFDYRSEEQEIGRQNTYLMMTQMFISLAVVIVMTSLYVIEEVLIVYGLGVLAGKLAIVNMCFFIGSLFLIGRTDKFIHERGKYRRYLEGESQVPGYEIWRSRVRWKPVLVIYDLGATIPAWYIAYKARSHALENGQSAMLVWGLVIAMVVGLVSIPIATVIAGRVKAKNPGG